MGRPPRAAEGGLVYYALNRANVGLTPFEDAADYEAFLRVLAKAQGLDPVESIIYCRYTIALDVRFNRRHGF